jgi:hypothetical protein
MLQLYDQTTFSDPEEGTHGDCLRACHATLLQVDPFTFPHPINSDGMECQKYKDALRKYGVEERFKIYWEGRSYDALPRILIAAGPTVRTEYTGAHHAVVWDRVANRMVHDPHQSRQGLTEIRFFHWLEDHRETYHIEWFK